MAKLTTLLALLGGSSAVVAPSESAPAGTSSTLTINEDTPRTFTTTDFGFSDADGHTFTAVRIDTLPAAGTLRLSGVAVTAGQVVPVGSLGNLVFTPAANSNGNGYTSFTFSVQDSSGSFDASPNTLTFNVTPVNDAPVAVADLISVANNTVANGNVLANDTDVDSGALTVTQFVVGGVTTPIPAGGSSNYVIPSVGTLFFNANGTYSFAPLSTYSGTLVSTYTVSDGTATTTGTLSITVAAPVSMVAIEWGFIFKTSSAGPAVRIREVTMHLDGGADLTTGMVASSTSTYDTPGDAINNNLTDVWASGDGTAGSFPLPQRLSVNLGTPQRVNGFSITTAGGNHPTSFDFVYSTDGGTTWQVAATYSSLIWTADETKNFTFTNPESTVIPASTIQAEPKFVKSIPIFTAPGITLPAGTAPYSVVSVSHGGTTKTMRAAYIPTGESKTVYPMDALPIAGGVAGYVEINTLGLCRWRPSMDASPSGGHVVTIVIRSSEGTEATSTFTVGVDPVTPETYYDESYGYGVNPLDGSPIIINPATGIKDPDTRIIYCDPHNSTGLASDSNNGQSWGAPVLTLANGQSKLRNNMPDWLVLPKNMPPLGAAFTSITSTQGVSKQRPHVVGTFDPADPTNINKMFKDRVTIGTTQTASHMNMSGCPWKNVVMIGISFEAPLINENAGIKFLGSVQADLNWLFYDCRFRRVQLTVQGGFHLTNPNGFCTIGNVTARRCVFAESPDQGWYNVYAHNVTAEDCLFYHNGWRIGYGRADGGLTSPVEWEPSIYDHGVYWATSTENAIIRRCVSAMNSHDGFQVRGGAAYFHDNVSADSPAHGSFGLGDFDREMRPSGVPFTGWNVVAVGSDRITGTKYQSWAWRFGNTAPGSKLEKVLVVNPTYPNEINVVPIMCQSCYPDGHSYMSIDNYITHNWERVGYSQDVNNWLHYSSPTQYCTAGTGTGDTNVHVSLTNTVMSPWASPPATCSSTALWTYPDPTRTSTSYATSLGYASKEAMYEAWMLDPLGKAAAFLDYIYAGFGVNRTGYGVAWR